MRLTFLVILLAWQGVCLRSSGQLTIDLDFTSFDQGSNWGALHADDWGPGTPDLVKQQAAEATIRAAADYWEAAFVNSSTSLSQSISVEWGSQSGGTRASGGAGWYPGSGNLAGGVLIWDSDGSSQFFVDETPWENTEWAKSSERSTDLGAGPVNVEQVYYNAAAGTSARDHADMLTVAIHEVGHALGLLGSYPRYAALDLGNDGDLDLMDGSELLYVGGHPNLTLAAPETPGTGYPYDGVFLSGSYHPMAMGPTLVDGSRKLLSDVDILLMASVHGFDNPVFNPQLIPESSTVFLGMIAFCTVLLRRPSAARAS